MLEHLDELFDIEHSGKLHAKFMVVDGHDVLLGSSNMDSRTASVYQANLRLRSRAVADELLQSLDQIEVL